MTVHPLILAGAKALSWQHQVAPDWPESPTKSELAKAEAVIRSLPNGEGLLAGTHAVLPVEATRFAWNVADNETSDPRLDELADALAAHLKAEKQG